MSAHFRPRPTGHGPPFLGYASPPSWPCWSPAPTLQTASSSATTWGRRPCRHQPGLSGHHGAHRPRRHDRHGAATAISLPAGRQEPRSGRWALVSALWLLPILGTVAPLLLHHWYTDILQALGMAPAPTPGSRPATTSPGLAVAPLLLASNLAVPYLLRNDGRPSPRHGTGERRRPPQHPAQLHNGGLAPAQPHRAKSHLPRRPWSACSAWVLLHPPRPVAATWRQLVPRFPAMPGLLFTGLPSLIASSTLGLLLLHNSQLMVHGTVRISAGFTVAGYTEAVFIVILQGLAFGIQPLVSQAAGAGRHRDLQFLMAMGLKITPVYGLGSG